jgi:hypothetical protein
MYSDEVESFAKFLAYVERFQAANLDNSSNRVWCLVELVYKALKAGIQPP